MAQTLGFGLVFELQNAFSSEASQIERSLGGIMGASKQLESEFANTVNSITQGFALMKAGTAILNVAASTVSAAADLEQQQMAFTTMLGSAAKARDMIKQIQQFAAVTPYETPEITNAAKQMMAYGFAQEKIIPTMRTLGDVASGLNIPLGQLTYLYGTIKTSGQAGLIDIRQFANRGIPIWEELAKVTGKTVKELTGMRGLKVPFAQVEQAFKNMTGTGGKFGGMMEAQSTTFNGLASTFNDNITLVKQEFGGVLLPYLKMGVDFLINFAQAAVEFAKTPFGKVVFLTAIAIGILLTVLGASIIAMSLARYASASLANSFLAMGRASIANAFATKGLTGGLRALAVSAYQAMVPFLPYIAIAVAVAGAFLLISNALSAYSDYISEAGKKGEGFTLFLQRLGGFVTALVQVFNSFDGTTFNLGGMEARLAELGILDLVLNMATWLVRLKVIFTSMFVAFGDIFTFISEVVGKVIDELKKAFKPLIDAFVNFTPEIEKTESSLDGWATAGKIMAGVIVGSLIVGVIALTVTLWSFASGVIAATWPIILIIAAIAAVVAIFYNWGDICDWFMENIWAKFGDYIMVAVGFILVSLIPTIISATIGFFSLAAGVLAVLWPILLVIAVIGLIIAIFVYWDEIVTWVAMAFGVCVTYISDLWNGLVSFMVSVFNDFVAWLFSVPESFVNWGASVVDAIKLGIMNAWDGFKAWFMSKIMEIPGISLAMEAMGGGMGGATNATASATVVTPSGGTTGGMFANMSNIMAEQKAGQVAGMGNVSVNVPESQKQPIINNIIVDGEILTKTVNDKNENNRNRRA